MFKKFSSCKVFAVNIIMKSLVNHQLNGTRGTLASHSTINVNETSLYFNETSIEFCCHNFFINVLNHTNSFSLFHGAGKLVKKCDRQKNY